MGDPSNSKFQFYSLGIIVEDKALGSDIVTVYPVEDLPNINGKIGDYKQEFKSNFPDSRGVAKTSTIESKATVKAKWVPLSNSNRMTSPDVIKNETVMLFKFSDTEDMYWTTLFREPGIRRRETVCYMFGNLKAPLKTWDKKTSYWFEVSTIDKHVKLHTSSSDGEPYEYDITIDTKEGFLEIKDDVGNSILMDSKQGLQLFKPVNKFRVETKDIELAASNSITETAGQSITASANTMSYSAGGSYKMSAATMTMDVSGGIAMKASDINIKDMLMVGSSVQSNGDIAVNGSITTSGNVAASGTVSGSNIT